MDRELTLRKLEALRYCPQRLREQQPGSAEALAADADLQDVLVLNLNAAAQLCVDIAAHLLATSQQRVPTTMGEDYAQTDIASVLPTAGQH